jgi:hypothetical protein
MMQMIGTASRLVNATAEPAPRMPTRRSTRLSADLTKNFDMPPLLAYSSWIRYCRHLDR